MQFKVGDSVRYKIGRGYGSGKIVSFSDDNKSAWIQTDKNGCIVSRQTIGLSKDN